MTLLWSQLLEELEQVIYQSGTSRGIEQNREKILSLLGEYRSNERDFEKFVHYHESGYTKNLVKEVGDLCNIIIMCWAPGQSSAVHSHEGSRCFVKVLAGQLNEQQVGYLGEDNTMGDSELNENDVTYIDDTIGAHRVANRSASEPAITLHVYMPPYRKCRILDESGSSQSRIVDVTFHSKFGAVATI